MTLQRQRLTWVMYAATGAWAAFVYVIGPATPLLAEDFALGALEAGLYGTAMAIGIISGGSASGRVTESRGRPTTFRLGLVSLLLGVSALAVAPGYVLSLLAVWAAGLGGALILSTTTAFLSDLHHEHGAAAITEANAIAAWIGAASPLVLGAFLAADLGWRGAIGLCVLISATALVLSRGVRTGGERAPDAAAPEPPPSGSLLNTRFVLTAVALFCAVGAEFGVNFWGATLLRELTTEAGATSAMSSVIIGLAIGRTAGARLSARMDTHLLLVGGFCLAGLGFAVSWLAEVIGLAVVGLLLVGLGLSVLFPFVMDRVVANSGGQSDRALGVASLTLGSAIGIAPFALGAAATAIPVRDAFLIVPGLLAVGLVATLLSRPVTSRPADSAAAAIA